MERTGGVSGKVCLIMNRPIVPLKSVECWGTGVLSEQLIRSVIKVSPTSWISFSAVALVSKFTRL